MTDSDIASIRNKLRAMEERKSQAYAAHTPLAPEDIGKLMAGVQQALGSAPRSPLHPASCPRLVPDIIAVHSLCIDPHAEDGRLIAYARVMTRCGACGHAQNFSYWAYWPLAEGEHFPTCAASAVACTCAQIEAAQKQGGYSFPPGTPQETIDEFRRQLAAHVDESAWSASVPDRTTPDTAPSDSFGEVVLEAKKIPFLCKLPLEYFDVPAAADAAPSEPQAEERKIDPETGAFILPQKLGDAFFDYAQQIGLCCPQGHHRKKGPCRRDYCFCPCKRCEGQCREGA